MQFRVRYQEVDSMGYAHHGNYAAYFEMGRTELMREHGIVYKEMEENGIILPLTEFSVKFYNPAHYDDLLTLETRLSQFTGVRLVFEYRLINQDKKLIAEGKTPLVFVNSELRKPIRAPKYIVDKFPDYFN